MDNRFYSESEACLSYISNKKVGIIGFGNQGEAHAKNLRDSGIDVAVNLRKSSDKIKLVTSLGFTLLSIESIVKWADIISIQIPDKLIPSVFNNISKMISSEKVILLSHGYVISYKKIKLTRYTNIVLVAPSSSGYALRKAYKKGRGVPGLISYIGEDSLLNIALAYSKGIGLTRSGVYSVPFDTETVSDLFGEQSVLVGGLFCIVDASFNTLIKKGYDENAAWLVCFYELKNIINSIYDLGFYDFFKKISHNAQMGSEKIINSKLYTKISKEFLSIIDDIEDGTFDKYLESEQSQKNYSKFIERYKNSKFNKTDKELRESFIITSDD